jgi:PTH1 family peptidyl-tRNA hydrolase
MFRRRLREPELPPEWLIVGLGNPGAQYKGTRHNVGFDAIEVLAERYKVKLETRRFDAVYGSGKIGGSVMILAKPVTFMNKSGLAVKQLMRHYQLGPEKLVIITDEMDYEPGYIKMRPAGGAGGHNGHRSIIQSLTTEDYARIKIGIGKPEESGVDHVLTRFAPEERVGVESVYKICAEGIEVLGTYGLERAITAINSPR